MKVPHIFAILLFLAICEKLACAYRVLGLFPLNCKSHFHMTQELMKELAKRGHQVDVVSHFPMKKPIPNYRDISLEGSLPIIFSSLTFQNITNLGISAFPNFVYNVGNMLCELIKQPQLQDIIKNPPKDPPYDFVIIETFTAPCYLAFGYHLKIPTIAIVVTSFSDHFNYISGNPINTAVTPAFLFKAPTCNGFWDRFFNTVLYHITAAMFNYFSKEQNKITRQIFGHGLPDIQELQKNISLYLVNSHYSLHGVRPWSKAIVEVAGLHINRDDDMLIEGELKTFLDGAKHGCVYFTFGSMTNIETFPNETIKALYRSFENIAPVRVIMKVAEKEKLLPGLPKNVMTQHWLPQIAILKHKNTKVFLTHGGTMGTMESISHGIPMVGIPLFGDQYTNMQIYTHHKAAVSFGSYKEITEESLTEALNTVLKEPLYKKNAEKLGKLFMERPLSPMNTALYWIEYVAKHGNVLQSPLLQLNWWQRNLIDVYSLILFIIFTVLYSMIVVFRILQKGLFKISPMNVNAEKKTKRSKRE